MFIYIYIYVYILIFYLLKEIIYDLFMWDNSL